MAFLDEKLQRIIFLWGKKARMGVKVAEAAEALVSERAWSWCKF